MTLALTFLVGVAGCLAYLTLCGATVWVLDLTVVLAYF